jgi:hypothetical protein
MLPSAAPVHAEASNRDPAVPALHSLQPHVEEIFIRGEEAEAEALVEVAVGEALDEDSPGLALVGVLLDVAVHAVDVLLPVLLLQLRVVTRCSGKCLEVVLVRRCSGCKYSL